MEKNIQSLFELNRDPMLSVADNKIVYYNSAAALLFDIEAASGNAVKLIPEHILFENSDRFIASAVVKGKNFSVSALRAFDSLVLTFEPLPQPATASEYLSSPLMSSMLSSLFNTGLAIDRISDQLESDENPKTREYMSILYHSYYSLRHMLSDLNSAIALGNGSMDFMPSPTDLAKLCSELVSTVSVLMSDNGVTLEFSTQSDVLAACVDSEKVERLLLELIVNSLKHTQEGDTIKLGLSKRGRNALISVEDNGSGIPASIMKNVFTRYTEQLSHDCLSESHTGGLGLGIARGIAELHHGALVIESRDGRGTSVHVLLPLGDEQSGRFSSVDVDYRTTGMTLVLTELSELLGSSYYTPKYMD